MRHVKHRVNTPHMPLTKKWKKERTQFPEFRANICGKISQTQGYAREHVFIRNSKWPKSVWSRKKFNNKPKMWLCAFMNVSNIALFSPFALSLPLWPGNKMKTNIVGIILVRFWKKLWPRKTLAHNDFHYFAEWKSSTEAENHKRQFDGNICVIELPMAPAPFIALRSQWRVSFYLFRPNTHHLRRTQWLLRNDLIE